MTLATYSPVHQPPKSYLVEDNGIYTLEIELPGVRKEETKVNVEGMLLKVNAMRKRGENEVHYEREFHLSEEVDTSNIKASSENGILTLILQRKPEAASKQIVVM